ncbi:MAG: glycosyltransferase family 2 protein [Candidatus Omnitrophica bacterium]|nr:glycosyltransferase family 2 protein [Candidatus Omnitrophota bacterium]
METKRVCVLIPAYNEGKHIGKIVSEIRKIVPSVFVVDDGSTDRTSEEAKKNGAVVIRHPQCKGKGAALKTGFQHIANLQFDTIITMDGDGQHSVSDLPLFLETIEKNKRAGVIVGKRKIIGTDMPLVRKLTNISMSLLISFLAFQWIPDSQNGFRAIKRNVLQKIHLLTDHFETETEMLLRASWKGVKISSIPVSTIYGSGKSKIRPGKDTVNFFLMLLKVILTIWKKK